MCFKVSKTVLVLDTGALLAKYYRLIPKSLMEIYTTTSAVGEVKDLENKSALEEAIELGFINIVNPEPVYVDTIIHEATRVGCLHKLSKTDIEIAALAFQLSRKSTNVVVITDDYELQNLLLYVGIGFRSLRTRGISELRVFNAYCPVCGYTPGKPNEEYCPLCGSKIVRKRIGGIEPSTLTLLL